MYVVFVLPIHHFAVEWLETVVRIVKDCWGLFRVVEGIIPTVDRYLYIST
jgi:hypothetical protein